MEPKNIKRLERVSKTWTHYIKKGQDCYIDQPNFHLQNLQPILPSYVNSVLLLGSTNGRDFIPFQDYELYAVDVFDNDDIDYIINKKVTYYRSLLQDIENIFNDPKLKDMSNFVVLSSWMLCYDRDYAYKFIKECFNRGCKNFVFKEPLPGDFKSTRFIYLNEFDHLFERKANGWNRRFKSHILCCLDADKNIINKYLEQAVDGDA